MTNINFDMLDDIIRHNVPADDTQSISKEEFDSLVSDSSESLLESEEITNTLENIVDFKGLFTIQDIMEDSNLTSLDLNITIVNNESRNIVVRQI